MPRLRTLLNCARERVQFVDNLWLLAASSALENERVTSDGQSVALKVAALRAQPARYDKVVVFLGA